MLDHQFDQAFGVGLLGQAEFFGNGLISAKHVPWPQAGLCDQAAELFDRQRFVVIIYLLVVDAVFTKQLCQIAARRSGRFFVNDYFVCHNFGAEARTYVRASAKSPGWVSIRFCDSSYVKTRDFVTNRTPSGISSENDAPRPGVTSMVSSVCCQNSNWSLAI